MQLWTKHNTECTKISVLLFSEFSNLCLANALEPLRAANTLSNQAVYHWDLYTLDGEPAISSSGIKVVPSGALNPNSHCERLFVISGYSYKTFAKSQTYKLLRQCKNNTGSIFGFDTGAWLLAYADLLENKKATIHWDLLDIFAETFLDVDVVKTPYVADGDIVTCGGAMATFDLILRLIGEDYGAALKFDVARLFIHSPALAIAPQIRNLAASRLTTRAMMLMQDNLETPIQINALSDQLECNSKTLERAFKAEFGVTTGKIYRRMRLLLIRKLVENSSLSISEISVRGGYDNASAMTRAFVNEFGVAPSSLRTAYSGEIKQCQVSQKPVSSGSEIEARTKKSTKLS